MAAPKASERPSRSCLTLQKKEMSRIASLFPQPARWSSFQVVEEENAWLRSVDRVRDGRFLLARRSRVCSWCGSGLGRGDPCREYDRHWSWARGRGTEAPTARPAVGWQCGRANDIGRLVAGCRRSSTRPGGPPSSRGSAADDRPAGRDRTATASGARFAGRRRGTSAGGPHPGAPSSGQSRRSSPAGAVVERWSGLSIRFPPHPEGAGATLHPHRRGGQRGAILGNGRAGR